MPSCFSRGISGSIFPPCVFLALVAAIDDRQPNVGRNDCESSSAGNISLQLLDDEFLIIDDRLDQVADGDDADQFSFFDDWQMAHALVRHVPRK